MSALARQVGKRLPGWRVRSATMALPGAIEREKENAIGSPLVFPFFMSNGWFTETALPARLELPRERILRPLGLDPSLPRFATPRLHEIARARGWRTDETEILVAAHGSASGRIEPERCARVFAEALSRLTPWRGVHVGFLEQMPLLSDVASRTGPKSLCIPFFAADGYHVARDIPCELRRGGFEGVLCPSVGSAGYIPELIAGALNAATLEKAA